MFFLVFDLAWIAGYLLACDTDPPQAMDDPTWIFAGAPAAAIGAVGGPMLRSQMYKSGWRGGAITDRACHRGNFYYWLMLGLAVAANTWMMGLRQAFVAYFLFAGVCIVRHLLSLPTGAPSSRASRDRLV